jgi:hydroxymethylbilane synthase
VRVIRLGTRGSALARWQSEHVAARLATESPDLRVAIVQIESAGDRMADVPLSHVEGTGFFTATLERALLAGDVDVAVHSHKDLPIVATPGLVVAAVPARGPAEDVLCARDGLRLDTRSRASAPAARRTAQATIRPASRSCSGAGAHAHRAGDRWPSPRDRAGASRFGATWLERPHRGFRDQSDSARARAGALAVQCRADDRLARSPVGMNDDETRRAVHGNPCSTSAVDAPFPSAPWLAPTASG